MIYFNRFEPLNVHVRLLITIIIDVFTLKIVVKISDHWEMFNNLQTMWKIREKKMVYLLEHWFWHIGSSCNNSPTEELGTLRNTTSLLGRCGQFFQRKGLSPGNTYQLKELANTSCLRRRLALGLYYWEINAAIFEPIRTVLALRTMFTLY